MNLYRRDARPSNLLLKRCRELVFNNIPRLEELDPGYEDHDEKAERMDVARAVDSMWDEEDARSAAPEVQCKKFKKIQEMCARRNSSTT